MFYGHCLLRLLHFVVALWHKFPSEQILILKFDLSSAYRQITHSALTAVQSIIVSLNIAYIYLCLAFGGAANPPAWSTASEMMCDLSNELPLIPSWNPSIVHHPDQDELPTPKYKDDSTPLATAQPLAFDFNITDDNTSSHLGRCDCFLDDLIACMLNRPSTVQRWSCATPLAIFLGLQPHIGDSEPVHRKPGLSQAKLQAEGTLAEIQIVLGWCLNTRRLLLSLPFDKYTAWTADIRKIIDGFNSSN